MFNLAAETKFGQTDEVYKEKVLDVCQKCASEALALKVFFSAFYLLLLLLFFMLFCVQVKKWVEVSTAQVYAPPKKGKNDESAKIEPWTRLAKFKFDCEELRKTCLCVIAKKS